MLHSVGDSHARCCFQSIPEVHAHEIGPVTMRSVGRSGKFLDGILQGLGILRTDTVILCFGEIDVRCHIHPRIRAGEAEDAIIRQLTQDYREALAGSSFETLWTMSLPPPARSIPLASYPFEGSDQDRSRYTRKMNAALCPRFDVYTRHCDAEGMLIPELSDGSVHIQEPKFIREELERLLCSNDS